MFIEQNGCADKPTDGGAHGVWGIFIIKQK